MVMFKEDEERIKAQEKAEKLAKRTPLGKWFRRLVKVTLILGVLLFIGLTLLSRIAGNSEYLQRGVTEFMESSTGMKVAIGEFHYLKLFPNVGIHLEDVQLTDPDTQAVTASATEFQYESGFFDLMFSRNRMSVLSIKEAFVSKALTGRRNLNITQAGLDANALGEGQPGLSASGTWGKDAFAVAMAGEVEMAGENIKSFQLVKNGAFNAKIGAVVIEGSVGASAIGGTKIDVTKLTDSKMTATGEITYNKSWGEHKVGFDLAIDRNKLQGDVAISPELVKGDIYSPQFHMEDIDSTVDMITAFSDLLSDDTQERSKDISLPEGRVEVDFELDELMGKNVNLGKLEIPVRINGNKMTINSVKGTFSGGKVDLEMVLDTSVSPTSMMLKGNMKDWDYGQIQEVYLSRKNLAGDADVFVELTANGNNFDAMMNALNGKITMIAGEGQFESKALNVWGAGLVNAIMPRIGDNDLTTLNCMVADFTVENGVAKADPLFLDTARLKVVGDGKVNLARQTIDLTLEPEAKGAAFLDIATAVNVKGPLTSPDIGPSTFSLLEKIGGLALGAINPAFLAFSMTDLGLTNNHPCAKFFNEDGQAAPAAEKADEAPAKKTEEPAPASSANEGVNE